MCPAETLIRVVVIEDIVVLRQEISAVINTQPGFHVVGEGGSVAGALEWLSTCQPDLVVLDVNLPDGTAFDILQHFIPLPFKIIFLTAFQEYALAAIKCGALDYLLKPVDATELTLALAKLPLAASSSHEQLSIARQYFAGTPTRIALSSQEDIKIVELRDIMYCESDAGYTTFYLTHDKKIVTSKILKEYESILPANQFIRTHQSFLVNLDFLDRYHRKGPREGTVTLKNGVMIPVSLRKREWVVDILIGKH